MSYLPLEKDRAMYPHQSSHHPGLSLSPQGFPAPPQYPDFASYHHHHHHGIGIDPTQQAPPGAGGWSYAPPPPPPTREDWPSHPYPSAAGGPQAASSVPVEFPMQQHALLPASMNPSAGQLSPGSPRKRNPYEWIRNSAPPSNPSKTHGHPCPLSQLIC